MTIATKNAATDASLARAVRQILGDGTEQWLAEQGMERLRVCAAHWAEHRTRTDGIELRGSPRGMAHARAHLPRMAERKRAHLAEWPGR